MRSENSSHSRPLTLPAGDMGARPAPYMFALPAVLLFVQGALTQWDLPGIYLDAVNPDYIVLRLLASPKNIPVWVLPGNLVFNTIPVLIQVYHGALPFFIGFPVYLIFGTGLFGIRLANMLFGLLVIAGLAAAMRALRINPVIAGLALAALALDSGFLFAFRTQFYITTLPLALVFASITLTATGRGRGFGAGALAGLSVYGYFCYAFLAPALAWHVWRSSPPGERVRRMARWSVGAAAGASPFAIGFILLLINKGGPNGFLAYLIQSFGQLGIVRPASLAERLDHATQMLVGAAQGIGPQLMMTGGVVALAPKLKAALLIGAPLLAFALSLLWREGRRAAQLPALGMAGIFALFLLFYTRAWLHHAAPALPLMYLGLAALGDQLAARWTGRRVLLAVALPFCALIYVNAVDRLRVDLALERTGGVKYYSDAMTQFEREVAGTPRSTHAFLPDWGLIFPLAMMTGGQIPVSGDFDPKWARRDLCDGRDALLAVMADKPIERLTAWIVDTDWPAPEVKIYRQRDGSPWVIAARWKADAPHNCEPATVR